MHIVHYVHFVCIMILLPLALSIFVGCFIVKADYRVTKQVKSLCRLALWIGTLIGSVLFLTSVLPGQLFWCFAVHLAVPALLFSCCAFGLHCGLGIQQNSR